MPPTPGPWPHEPQVEAVTTGASGAHFPTSHDDGPLTVVSDIQESGKNFLLLMPVEIIANILIEWSIMEWPAPAIARQVCRCLKEITDSSPRLWSKLFLPSYSPATVDDVCSWLRCAKAVPKEICLDTEDIRIISAALEGAKDATSLIYRIPIFTEIPDDQQKLIQLPMPMPKLRHLRLDTSNVYDFMSMRNIFGPYNSCSAQFPCLTILHLVFVDLAGFHIMPGLFPAIRRLALHFVCGPVLNLIQVCSGSLEDLRGTSNLSYRGQSIQRDRIFLPKLKVLILCETPGIVPHLEAPALRLICANLDEIDGATVPFGSVVEWATRLQSKDITDQLINMPQLRHLMLFQRMETLKLCFESLRDRPNICPYLQSIEVADFADAGSETKVDTHFKDLLKACVAPRAEKVPGFALQFVENYVQTTRFEQYHATYVRSFVVMCHYLS